MTRSRGVDLRRRRALDPFEPAPQTAGHGTGGHATVARALAGPGHLTPGDVLRLQRAAGNSAVTRMIARNGDGPKLKIKQQARANVEAESQAKGRTVASTHPDAKAVKMFLTIVDDNLQAAMQVPGAVEKLNAAARASESDYMPECSAATKKALAGVYAAIAAVVETVFESTDDLIASSGPERQQQ